MRDLLGHAGVEEFFQTLPGPSALLTAKSCSWDEAGQAPCCLATHSMHLYVVMDPQGSSHTSHALACPA